MDVRAVKQTPVRTLINSAHSIDDPSATLSPSGNGAVAANVVNAVQPTPPANDHFINIVDSRPSIEVNPHLWAWQAEALDAWHQSRCRGVVEAVTGAGKTMIGITAAFEAFRQGIKVLVLVPTADLQTQWQRRLMETLLPRQMLGRLEMGGRIRSLLATFWWPSSIRLLVAIC